MDKFERRRLGRGLRPFGLMFVIVGLAPPLAHGLGDPDVITPLAVTAVAPPNPVLGADGRIHLAYELLLLNKSPFLATVDSVEVLDLARGDAVVQDVRGDSLAKVFRLNGQEKGTTLGPSHSAYLFLDVTQSREAKLPPRLRHRFSITLQARASEGDDHKGASLPADSGAPPHLSFTGVPTRVGVEPAVVVAPPLKGPRWVVGNGCCATVTSHRGATIAIDGTVHVPERFAIDFVQLDGQGRLFTGPVDQLSSYRFFGNEVHSVADGRVVGTQEGQPEGVPGKLPNMTMETAMRIAGGNYVVVDIGKGRFAFYAHLQPGSLKVKKGDRVRRGQVLGLLGDSGNSDAPHLHFHVMDGPSPLAANGLPFVFTSFTGQGVVTDEQPVFRGDPAPIDRAALAGPHKNELPLNDQVVGFP